MLAKISACGIWGLDGIIVEVEVDTTSGLPGMVIVGLPDAAVQESRERVHSAIKNSALDYPRKRVRVNLAPASLRKEGPAYDLPIAVGILAASGQIPLNALQDSIFNGELSLDGSLRHIRGILPITVAAKNNGFKRIFVPEMDAGEAALIPDIDVIPIRCLMDIYQYFANRRDIPPYPTPQFQTQLDVATTNFREIKGQEQAKRALEIAAAGGHNVLMIGSPGSGKTLMARSLPSILPSLSIEEALDVTRIYSVADMLPSGTPLIQERPFRAPHHTISHAGLVGGGNLPHPGEISLAHLGILFLDEFPEFGSRVLEVMRQPMEDKAVTISRAQGSLTFPASFQLIAAMNPCPCGFFGDPVKPCSCSSSTIAKYQKRISGPLLDRMDISIQVPRVEYDKLTDSRLGEDSATIQERVEKARAIQRERFNFLEDPSRPVIHHNADMGIGEIRKFCSLTPECKSLLQSAVNRLQLSARGYHRVLKISRTIADLAGENDIAPTHIAEALQYRSKLSVMM
jgi:magnesium chelatase family protein